jgi:hypothetical protein
MHPPLSVLDGSALCLRYLDRILTSHLIIGPYLKVSSPAAVIAFLWAIHEFNGNGECIKILQGEHTFITFLVFTTYV